jgi:hypothetical protein
MPPWRDDIHSALARTELTLAELVLITGEPALVVRDYLLLHRDLFGVWVTCEDGFPVRRYFIKDEA